MRTTLVTAAVFLAVGVSSASAETFCVHSNVDCSGTPADTLGSALSSAKLNGSGRDTIRLPAGNFNDLPAVDEDGNPVDIVGAGPGATILNSAANGGGLTLRDPSSVASNLQVHASNTSGYSAVVLGGTLDHVKVTGVATQFGAVGVDTNISGTATIKNSSIDLAHNGVADAIGIFCDTWSFTSITGTNVRASRGVSLQESAADIEQSRIWAEQGIAANTGSNAVVRNSTIRTPGPIAHAGPEYAFKAWGAGYNEIDVISSTAYGDGDVGSTGALVQPQTNQSATISLAESVLAHYANSANIDTSDNGTATLYTTWSAYDFTRLTGAGLHGHAHDVDLAGRNPGFVDADGGDLRLRFDSALVDAGDPAAGTSGDVDLDGNPRTVDGGHGSARLDLGAFEYQHQAPSVNAQATPAGGSAGQAIAFNASATDADPGEAVAINWSFDDGTTAAGTSVTHAFASAGRHTATATATDASGLSASAPVTVTIDAPAGSAGAPQIARPAAVAPAISGLRFNRGRASFRLSQSAVVTVTVERQKGHKWVRVASVKVKRGAGSARVAVVHKKLHSGRYRARVIATNAAGMRSKPALAKFRVQ